jgi:hypothetical protein
MKKKENMAEDVMYKIYWDRNLTNNSMERSPSLEASSSAANREIPRVLCSDDILLNMVCRLYRKKITYSNPITVLIRARHLSLF